MLKNIGTKKETAERPDEDVRQKYEMNVEEIIGLYNVGLRWKNEVDLANKEAVTKRLQKTTRKLLSDTALMNTNDHAIRHITSGGHEEKIIERADNCGIDLVYYLQHNTVIREGRTMTKIRHVFHASSHRANTKSLNPNPKCNSCLNSDLLSILLKFRKHRIAIISGIGKAFLQIQ